ncbi:hypothetical protein BC826DRAFT_397202 [Russula brevipes]|nr:hypothetical protein BC826DRAFT_397202 [Russula brevipes]
MKQQTHRGYRHGACSGTPETAAEGKGRSGRVAPTGEDRHRRKSAGEAIQETLPTVGDTGVVEQTVLRMISRLWRGVTFTFACLNWDVRWLARLKSNLRKESNALIGKQRAVAALILRCCCCCCHRHLLSLFLPLFPLHSHSPPLRQRLVPQRAVERSLFVFLSAWLIQTLNFCSGTEKSHKH